MLGFDSISEDAISAYDDADSGGGTVAVRTVTKRVKTATGSVRKNLTGISWAFFDSISPALLSAPVAQGHDATTDASGFVSLTVANTTLDVGDTGYLLLSIDPIDPSQPPQSFAGPVSVQ